MGDDEDYYAGQSRAWRARQLVRTTALVCACLAAGWLTAVSAVMLGR